jgi:hypothetical protein
MKRHDASARNRTLESRPTSGRHTRTLAQPRNEQRVFAFATSAASKALGHDPAHHTVPLAFGADVVEASPLVQGPCCVVEHGYILAVGGVVRVPLHDSACGLRDQVDRTTERDRRHALPPVFLVHEDARDPVVRQLVAGLLVLLAVVDVWQFPRRAVLGPGDCLVAVEDQGGVRPILLDQLPL